MSWSLEILASCITGLNRRTRIQYLVVTSKGIIETKILTFPCGGKNIFIQNARLQPRAKRVGLKADVSRCPLIIFIGFELNLPSWRTCRISLIKMSACYTFKVAIIGTNEEVVVMPKYCD